MPRPIDKPSPSEPVDASSASALLVCFIRSLQCSSERDRYVEAAIQIRRQLPRAGEQKRVDTQSSRGFDVFRTVIDEERFGRLDAGGIQAMFVDPRRGL